MAQNLVINGVTYNGVESLEMTNDSGEKVRYSEGGTEATPWLLGRAEDITPQQVVDALTNERDVMLCYAHPQFGDIWFTAFNFSEARNALFSSGLVNIDNVWTAFQLEGRLEESYWRSHTVPIALKEDIPTVPGTDELVAAVVAALPKYNGEVADA